MNSSVEVILGRGRVLAARNRSDVNFSESDAIFSGMAENEVSAIDGQRAGALMTALLILVLENRSVASSIILIGTVDPSGNVGEIAGAVEKVRGGTRGRQRPFSAHRGDPQAHPVP